MDSEEYRQVCVIGDSFLQQLGITPSCEYSHHVGECILMLDNFTHQDFTHHEVTRLVEHWRATGASEHRFGYEGLVWEAVSVLTLRRIFELAGIEEDAIALLFSRYSTRVAEVSIHDAFRMIRNRQTVMTLEVVRWIIPHFMFGRHPRGWTHDYVLL